jgi:hypothetical protein
MLFPRPRSTLPFLPASHPRLSPATLRCIDLATARTVQAMQTGALLTSREALLMAGPEARRRDTLYSIAQRTALEDGGDPDYILEALERRFRGWR